MKHIFGALLIVGAVACQSEQTEHGDHQGTEQTQTAAAEAMDKTSAEEKFNMDFTAYVDAANAGEWDKIADMMYPKMFEKVSKEQFTQSFKSLEAQGLKMKTEVMNVKEVSDIVEEGERAFAMIDYEGIISVKLPKILMAQKDLMMQGFEQTMKDDGEVSFDEETSSFKISGVKSMLAISEDKGKTWKYLEYQEQAMDLISSIASEETLKKLEQ